MSDRTVEAVRCGPATPLDIKRLEVLADALVDAAQQIVVSGAGVNTALAAAAEDDSPVS